MMMMVNHLPSSLPKVGQSGTRQLVCEDSQTRIRKTIVHFVEFVLKEFCCPLEVAIQRDK